MGLSQSVIVPPPILVSDLVSDDPDAGRTQLCEYLVKYGFAVLRDSPENVEMVRECRSKVSEFFHLPMEEKKKYEIFVEDDIRGKRRVNRGYLSYQHKEFLKIRLNDPQESYPTVEGLHHAFSSAMNHMHDIVHSALRKVSIGSQEVFADSDGPWIKPDFLETAKEFLIGGSSLSVIRYYNMMNIPAESIIEEKVSDPSYEDSMAPKSVEDDVGGSAGASHIPCGEHYDTGIFTLILLSEIPGLQVENRETKEWIPIEKVGQTGDFALIMGRKIDLLKAHRDLPLKPTFHRVEKSNDIERQSILFFYDLQTSPHD
jgi:isopenicillin N synthase-like dioxygenase